eukprot:CAMPEP_0174379492 /NCGR_PEP_ID=MMETSP0811_2-20130205/122751_1 /TAXON_ID=73025 ORGANISM="Eutreptiella gymnastica-like, Strain CCMP1594" /NCGR_SAMPLE_ID=MMETSP0811_2 /ASSEMBLY_ACC=CAM_ASM_000667 /LENGTH=155 /DNA_ID=CAMNT_0015532057 /DNA_START=1269 /DNA_END=1736 /DNA_ORIENTATION=-
MRALHIAVTQPHRLPIGTLVPDCGPTGGSPCPQGIVLREPRGLRAGGSWGPGTSVAAKGRAPAPCVAAARPTAPAAPHMHTLPIVRAQHFGANHKGSSGVSARVVGLWRADTHFFARVSGVPIPVKLGQWLHNGAHRIAHEAYHRCPVTLVRRTL